MQAIVARANRRGEKGCLIESDPSPSKSSKYRRTSSGNTIAPSNVNADAANKASAPKEIDFPARAERTTRLNAPSSKAAASGSGDPTQATASSCAGSSPKKRAVSIATPTDPLKSRATSNTNSMATRWIRIFNACQPIALRPTISKFNLSQRPKTGRKKNCRPDDTLLKKVDHFSIKWLWTIIERSSRAKPFQSDLEQTADTATTSKMSSAI